MLSDQALKQIDQEVAKYPSDRKQAAVMAALTIAQGEIGYVSDEVMKFVAGLLELQPIQVAEVASFYTMYNLEPGGKHNISVCTNISCMLRGCDRIVAHLEQRLGIKLGETSADGKYTLKEVECLAACGGAPMFQIGDEYHEHLTPERVDAILDKLD